MMPDLSTEYLGLKLKSPLVASAGPLTGAVETLRRLSEAGAGAVVLPSLFEEQIEHEAQQWEQMSEFQSDSFAEGLSYFPEMDDYRTGPHDYLQLIESAKANVQAPVIASLNGHRISGWTEYAKQIEAAGADALELNIYRVVTDPKLSADDVEREYVELLARVCQAVRIPVAVKLGPSFTALPHFARRLEEAGAAGLVLFNRFLHPDIDLAELSVRPHLALSTPIESLQSVRWIAILRDILGCSIASTSGVHDGLDAVKLILVGADVVMMTSALLKFGPEHLLTVRQELSDWLAEHEYVSVSQMKGSLSQKNCPDPSGFERANYMKALLSYTSDSI